MLKKIIQSILKRFGLRLVRESNVAQSTVQAPSGQGGLDWFFALLRREGFQPRHIVDVGANRGNWTRTALLYFPEAQYTLVEPQDGLKIYIQDLIEGTNKIAWINAGAADKSGTLPFVIPNRDDSSTFSPPPHYAGLPQILVPVMTLNEIVSMMRGPVPEIVKIDAEGFDLKVLAGASDLLGKTDVFFVEVTICSQGYENTIANVIRKMDEAGYHVVEITDLNRSPKHGVLWLCELAFLRNDCRLLADTTSSYE